MEHFSLKTFHVAKRVRARAPLKMRWSTLGWRGPRVRIPGLS